MMRRLSIRQLSAAYAAGALDPVGVTESVLARARAGDPALFISWSEDRALTEAQASALRWKAGMPLGPLDGVPTVWKDLFDMAGSVTTAASAWLADAPPATADAEAVTALRRAGVVSIGKVNLSEFAFSGLGLNPHFGTPQLPGVAGPARAPGGSSSGTACAVAAGLVPFGMGTDTGGSLRIPAAFQGLVGYQPSVGRHDKRGVFPLSQTLDVPGPIGVEVMDCIFVDQALRGATPRELDALPPERLQVVVPDNVVWDDCEPATQRAVMDAIHNLESAGVAVQRCVVPELTQALQAQAELGSLVGAEAYALHRERVQQDSGRFDPRVLTRLRRGQAMLAADLVLLQNRRAALQQDLARWLGERLLLWPTVVHEAPELAPLQADATWFDQCNQRTLRNTMLANFLGLCGVSLPAGHGRDGLPVALSLHALGHHDHALLRAALAVAPVLHPGPARDAVSD